MSIAKIRLSEENPPAAPFTIFVTETKLCLLFPLFPPSLRCSFSEFPSLGHFRFLGRKLPNRHRISHAKGTDSPALFLQTQGHGQGQEKQRQNPRMVFPWFSRQVTSNRCHGFAPHQRITHRTVECRSIASARPGRACSTTGWARCRRGSGKRWRPSPSRGRRPPESFAGGGRW